MPNKSLIHPSAEVSTDAILGKNVRVWHLAQIRENVSIGDNCILGKNVYIDVGVKIGKNCKIQNNVSIFHGVTLADGVFVGPHVCFTNDKYPRAVNPDLSLKSGSDWKISPTKIGKGVSIGANSTILPGLKMGAWSMLGAGSLLSKDLPPFCLAVGNPARVIAKIDKSGKIVERL